MRTPLFWTALAATVSLSIAPGVSRAASAPGPVIHDEQIEWTWIERPKAPDPHLPNVLFVGDSITKAYFPHVAKLLEGKYNCYDFTSSYSSADRRLTGELAFFLKWRGVKFDVVHVNNGLHGPDYTDEQYAAGLGALIGTIKTYNPHARLIWGTTTPIRNDVEGWMTKERVIHRNALAMAEIKPLGLEVDDLYGLMMRHPGLHVDEAHYTEQGQDIQAAQVADVILHEHR